MIRELESKGLMLNEEKKGYEERLEQEAKARQVEHEKTTVSRETPEGKSSLTGIGKTQGGTGRRTGKIDSYNEETQR